MRFKTTPGRRRMPPWRVDQFEEGDFVIFGPDRAFPKAPLLIYRPPGSDMVYSAPLVTDRNKADKRGTAGTYWWWNGDPDKPTVAPSLGVPATPPYTWHGWLTAGRFETCE